MVDLKVNGAKFASYNQERLPRIINELLIIPNETNTIWALYFMYDALYYGRPFRTLNVIDESTWEVLPIEIDLNFPAARGVRILE